MWLEIKVVEHAHAASVRPIVGEVTLGGDFNDMWNCHTTNV